MKIPTSVTQTVFKNTLSPINELPIPNAPKLQEFISDGPKPPGINSNLNTDVKQSISTNQILLIFIVISIVGLTLYAIHKQNQKEKQESDHFNF